MMYRLFKTIPYARIETCHVSRNIRMHCILTLIVSTVSCRKHFSMYIDSMSNDVTYPTYPLPYLTTVLLCVSAMSMFPREWFVTDVQLFFSKNEIISTFARPKVNPVSTIITSICSCECSLLVLLQITDDISVKFFKDFSKIQLLEKCKHR